MQLDKPYSIGHWVEINCAGQKCLGQVVEISWRATLMQSVTDEMMTLPNRLIAQSQVSNFSDANNPPMRSLVFKFDYITPFNEVESILIEATKQIPEILKLPLPTVLIVDNTDWAYQCKLIFWIKDFGQQAQIKTLLMRECLTRLSSAGLLLSTPIVRVQNLPPISD